MRQRIMLIAGLVAISAIGLVRSDGEAQTPPKTCATDHPKHPTSAPSGYSYDSEDQAFRDLVSEYPSVTLRKEQNRARATGGPCPDIGWHTKVRATWKKNGRDAFYPASLVGCPICKDTSSGPELSEKWRIIYKN